MFLDLSTSRWPRTHDTHAHTQRPKKRSLGEIALIGAERWNLMEPHFLSCPFSGDGGGWRMGAWPCPDRIPHRSPTHRKPRRFFGCVHTCGAIVDAYVISPEGGAAVGCFGSSMGGGGSGVCVGGQMGTNRGGGGTQITCCCEIRACVPKPWLSARVGFYGAVSDSDEALFVGRGERRRGKR